jgi:hypothetical protein
VEVGRAISFPKKSKERKNLLEMLRNRGNFQHNLSRIREGVGTIVPCKRPARPKASDKYVPCTMCFVFLPNASFGSMLKTAAKKW